MRLAHLSDLHIGKKFNEISLYEDQEIILEQIINILREEEVDTVLISGDVYDKAQPAARAVSILNGFLTELSSLGVHILMIAGNHDAPARLAYGGSLFKQLDIHLAGKLEGLPEVVTLSDEFGPVNFVMLPFFRLHEIKTLFPENLDELDSYTNAVKFILKGLDLPENERKVILSHQYFAGIDPVKLSESEMDIIGGLNAIDVKVLDGFTYAALGHIHRPQKLWKDNFRYAGSPLAYSFSEINQNKVVPIIDLDERLDNCDIKLLPLRPLRVVREIEGRFDEILEAAKDEDPARTRDILRVKLTDEKRLINAMRRLQAYYPNIVHLQFEREIVETEYVNEEFRGNIKNRDFIALFSMFYKTQTTRDLSEEDRDKLAGLWHEMSIDEEEEQRT